MDDFRPVNVLKQVPKLADLYDSRSKLKDLLTKLDENGVLDHIFLELVNDADKRNELKTVLNNI